MEAASLQQLSRRAYETHDCCRDGMLLFIAPGMHTVGLEQLCSWIVRRWLTLDSLLIPCLKRSTTSLSKGRSTPSYAISHRRDVALGASGDWVLGCAPNLSLR